MLILAAFSAGCSARTSETSKPAPPSPTVSAKPDSPIDVTIRQLLEEPKHYDGRTIRTIGFVYIEFEGNIISDGPDKKYSHPIHHIWLELDEDIRRNHAKYNQRYVLVEGTLNAKNGGHLNLSVAAIENIRRFEVVNKKPKLSGTGSNKSLDASGGSVFRNWLGAAKVL